MFSHEGGGLTDGAEESFLAGPCNQCPSMMEEEEGAGQPASKKLSLPRC